MNKELVSEVEFLSRIRAAVLARERHPSGNDIVIIARSDALQGYGYAEARDRLRRAVEVGADVVFLEGIESREQAKQFCEDLAPTPALFNCVAGGVSPELTVNEADELGFKMIIYPLMALNAVLESVSSTMESLKREGAPIKSEATTVASGLKRLFEVVGLTESIEFDIAAGGKLFSRGV
jgi:2-methylisocitrate lyase-like PEP mutase family enzyme